MISDSTNQKNFRHPMWSMIADKYSRAFYASGLFEFSDQLKKKQVSQYITYLYTNLHVC